MDTKSKTYLLKQNYLWIINKEHIALSWVFTVHKQENYFPKISNQTSYYKSACAISTLPTRYPTEIIQREQSPVLILCDKHKQIRY